MSKKQRKNKNRRAPTQGGAVAAGARLVFPPSPGTIEGFTHPGISSYSAEPASCVRELVQNALDSALVNAKEPCAIVRFILEKYKTAKIPGIQEYRKALKSAGDQEQNALSRGIVRSLRRYAEQEESSVLFVVDNGAGFDEKRLGAVLGDGVSQQEGEQSRGAFGNGHLTAFALSGLHYIFYGGVTKDGSKISSGHAILSSHIGDYQSKKGRALSKDGYYVKNIHENKLDFARFDFPRDSEIPELLCSKIEMIEHESKSGAVIAITAFNDFNGESDIEDIILREAALNFYVAIYHRQLRVEILRDGRTQELTAAKLRGILEERQSNMRGRRDFPSGRRIWNSYETLISGEEHLIPLSSSANDKVKLILRQGGDGKRVGLCRNGMWITGSIPGLSQADFGDRKPFDALLLVDAETSGEAHNLVKLAETPLHNKIEIKRLNSKEDRSKLRKSLGEIKDYIKKLVEEKRDDRFSPADILPIQVASQAMRGKTPRQHGQIRKIGGGGAGTGGSGDGKNTKKKRNISRSGKAVSTKVSSRRIKPGALEVIFAPEEDCDDVEMRLSLDSGTDLTCAADSGRLLVYMRDIRIDNNTVPEDRRIKDDNGETIGVRLGKWKSGEHYGIHIEYDPPVESGLYTLVFDLLRRKARQNKNGKDEDVGS